ncbi:MAG TPA: DUF1501 domain-containing protein [Solimonas sp.]|nr:DUF1501 domain-containing protein [Solimonas sp.]
MSALARGLSRRQLLRSLAGLPSLLLPGFAFGGVSTGRYLILVELKGGNDDLNACPLLRDPVYRRLRPTLAIAERDTITVSAERGFHPALRPLLPAWDAGELALIQGIGYPDPDLSHFRSGSFWDTAKPGDYNERRGWLPWVLSHNGYRVRTDGFDAVAIGFQLGPLAGAGLHTLQLNQAAQPTSIGALDAGGLAAANEAQAHLVTIWNDWVLANKAPVPAAPLRHSPTPAFPDKPFGDALKLVAGMLQEKDAASFYRVTLGGFDTHYAQPVRHQKALDTLGAGLMALRSVLQQAGLWRDTLVVCCSEFGRRPVENDALGTDHGTAGVAFAMGGAVRGGWLGERPNLEQLDATGNLAHTIHFRRLYNTLALDWLRLKESPIDPGRFPPLPLISVPGRGTAVWREASQRVIR